MFATQLLRILQTVTTDVKHETCVHDSTPQQMIMKENQNITTHHNSQSFGTEEMHQLTSLRRDRHPSFLEAKATDECRNPKTNDNLSMENQNRARNSTPEEFLNAPFLSSDNNILEYEHPELIVCYKEINYHVVKDICVDEGIPTSRKIVIDSCKNHHKANGAIDEEENQQGSKNKSNAIKLIIQDSPKLPPESSLTNIGAAHEAATPASDEESFVDKALPIQEFGTRSFLRSFLNSLDGDENKTKPPLDQFCETLTEPVVKEDLQESILCYKSEVESRSITFNFTNGKTETSLHSRDQKNAEADILSKDFSFDNNDPVVSLRRCEEESSFSADDFITHSGPIAFSGSISIRSDGSATSGKSFAFPVLQGEWISSPVRMREANRRRWKHKGWRSGLLCCRF